MQFTTIALSLLGAVAVVEAIPNNAGWGWTSSCWTSSTCKATTYSKPSTTWTTVPVTYSETTWVPETVTATVLKTYYSTSYETEYLTSYETKTETREKPTEIESYTTICYTKPVWIWTYEQYTTTAVYAKPYESVSTEICTETSKSTEISTTQTQSVETSVSKKSTSSIVWAPATTTSCSTSTGWTTYQVQTWG